MHHDIGKVNEIANGFEWKIENFFSLCEEPDQDYTSPDFCYNGDYWYFEIYPNGYSDDGTDGYIDVCLIIHGRCLPIRVYITLALKTIDGGKYLKRHCTAYFNERRKRHNSFRFISRSELVKRKDELVPSDVLTVVCTMKNLKFSECDITTAVCQFCKKIFSVQEISFHEKKCRIKCPNCLNIILLQNWNDHECQASITEDCTSLCENYKNVLFNGLNHDLILKFGNKELRAHQDILRSRSKVFELMLSHDTKEKQSGVIDIPDCDPKAMEQFLLYIYSGKVEKLDETNMLQLYYIADKYDMNCLKEECCSFLKTCISSTNFCEVVQLALNHSDSGLLKFATDYFIDNPLNIMRTVEWQIFLKENSTVANELTIKTIEKLKDAKT